MFAALPLGPCAPPSARGTGQVRDRDRSRESARSVREIGRLPKIRTPGAQTGRCAARRRATITACPVWWDGAAKAIAARLRRSIAISAVRERRVGSPPELPPLHQTATPCDQRAELTAFRTGAVRACNRWRAAGRAGRPRRDRSPPRGAPVRRRRPQCHGHAESPRPKCQPDWLWRSRSCRPRAPP